MSSEFEPTGSEVAWEGGIVKAGSERFRYADGTEVTRDKVWHPGAVGIVALDDERVWLTRQPREVIGQDPLASHRRHRLADELAVQRVGELDLAVGAIDDNA